MKKLILSLALASLTVLVVVGAAFAAGPGRGSGDQLRDRDRDRDRDTVSAILGLTQAQIMELRQDRVSLAQIAERQHVDPQKLVDALVARWTERIEWRFGNGAITSEQAAQLRSEVRVRAMDMIYKVTTGGMQGAAIGAGPQAGTMAGTGNGPGYGAGSGPKAASTGRGNGTGICDGSGRN